MPKLSSETVTLLDGDIRVFKRPCSCAWQATFKMDGYNGPKALVYLVNLGEHYY
jgi:hypothetical protein